VATIAADAATEETGRTQAQPETSAQVGASSFSDLVRAHFQREQERAATGAATPETEERFRRELETFEAAQGTIEAVYWSTRNASAIAMTIGKPKHQGNPFTDTDTKVRLHRLTDWVTADAEPIADLLHDCDLLAIRVSEVLRGTSERIAMRWLFAVQEHLLGVIERCGRPGEAQQQEVVDSQRLELVKIEKYYLRAGSKAGRIVYVSGMLLGASVAAAACAVAAYVVHRHAHDWNRDFLVLLLCVASGAVGALVSVLSRMSSGDEKFTVDFEVGRPLLRRLGLYKPLVGSIFGVALYFLLASGLLMTQPPDGNHTDFYAIAAFFAGFSERFTGVIFGSAEKLIAGGGGAAPDADADDEPQ
jgi:hypothetical protein